MFSVAYFSKSAIFVCTKYGLTPVNFKPLFLNNSIWLMVLLFSYEYLVLFSWLWHAFYYVAQICINNMRILELAECRRFYPECDHDAFQSFLVFYLLIFALIQGILYLIL